MGILYNLRQEYIQYELLENDTPGSPFQLFAQWFNEIRTEHPDFEANAMTLATASNDGMPSARIVLLKSFEKQGLVFFTNFNSRKANDLNKNNKASLLFYWHPMERQVRIEGKVKKIPDEESDLYFNSRPTESQIGAWTSPQSSEIPNRQFLDDNYKTIQKKYDKNIPRPEFWGGYQLIPNLFEFWQGRKSRLHDRIEYFQDKKDWRKRRLAP